jgi:hypothetical protein
MYILKQHSNDDGIAVVSSSVNNKDLLSFLCYRSRHMEINAEPVSSVEFPNILATDVVHDYTEKPLFSRWIYLVFLSTAKTNCTHLYL